MERTASKEPYPFPSEVYVITYDFRDVTRIQDFLYYFMLDHTLNLSH